MLAGFDKRKVVQDGLQISAASVKMNVEEVFEQLLEVEEIDECDCSSES